MARHLPAYLGGALAAFLLLMLPSQDALCQSDPVEPDDAARKARIAENIKFSVPQLREVDIVVMQLGPGDTGLDEGVVVLGGQQAVKFLITPDDEQLFLLAMDAIDASRSTEDLAALLQQEQEAAEAAIRKRAAELLEQSAGSPVRGNIDAPVTIVEFSDFECPYCGQAAQTMEALLKKYPDDIRMVYMHFPLDMHPWAVPAAVASVCAADQSNVAFWGLHDHFFSQQDVIEAGTVVASARSYLEGTDIDLSAWSVCAEDETSEAYRAALARVNAHMQIGRGYGITGTPAFFINGRYLNGAKTFAEFEATIAEARRDGLSEKDLADLLRKEEESERAAARDRSNALLVASAGQPTRGNPDARITIIEFSDFQCPYCADATKTLDQVLSKYEADVRIVYMHLPLDIHPWAEQAAIASVCAANQEEEAFWALHDFFFENQGAITPATVVDKARLHLAERGIDLALWETCTSDTDAEAYSSAKALVDAHTSVATKYGVTGTPGFFVNGRYVYGAQSLATFDAIIEAAQQELIEQE